MANKRGADGGCLCGGVRYRVGGDLRDALACHCTKCRKTTGHYAVFGACRNEDLAFECAESLAWYESSPGVRRGFCGKCGSTLFWDDPVAGLFRRGRGVAGRAHGGTADRAYSRGGQGRLLPGRGLHASRHPSGEPGRCQSRPGVTQRRLPLTWQATAGYSRGGRLPCCEILYVRQGFPPGPSNRVLTPMT